MKEIKSKTAILTTLIVYDGEGIIGNGWFLWYNGRNYKPNLISLKGEPLEEGWYSLQATEQHLVVINRSIH